MTRCILNMYVSSSKVMLLQYALYQQENEVLNNSETDFIHALFSIEKLYILSRFSKNNV